MAAYNPSTPDAPWPSVMILCASTPGCRRKTSSATKTSASRIESTVSPTNIALRIVSRRRRGPTRSRPRLKGRRSAVPHPRASASCRWWRDRRHPRRCTTGRAWTSPAGPASAMTRGQAQCRRSEPQLRPCPVDANIAGLPRHGGEDLGLQSLDQRLAPRFPCAQGSEARRLRPGREGLMDAIVLRIGGRPVRKYSQLLGWLVGVSHIQLAPGNLPKMLVEEPGPETYTRPGNRWRPSSSCSWLG